MKKKAGWVAGLDLAGDAWAGPREGKKRELGKGEGGWLFRPRNETQAQSERRQGGTWLGL